MAADPEPPVKNGGELLDRLLKDIVGEVASDYVPTSLDIDNPNLPPPHDMASKLSQLEIEGENDKESVVDRPKEPSAKLADFERKTTFSLSRFIPLLSERVYVIHPSTRMHLLSWVRTLDSIPDLEMVAWLPEFLDGILWVKLRK